jgi:hypothetical protein
MSRPRIRTEASSSSNNPVVPLNYKHITFTVTSVSESPFHYHIQEDHNAVQVFLNRPLSRLDLHTVREILHQAEKPCHPAKVPLSAPPSPNYPTNYKSNNPPNGPTSNMKLSKTLFVPNPIPQEVRSPSHVAYRGHDTHKGGKPRQILFYDKNKPYYSFTNFSDYPVKYKGRMYPTSEHLFQSLKVKHSSLYLYVFVLTNATVLGSFTPCCRADQKHGQAKRCF